MIRGVLLFLSFLLLCLAASAQNPCDINVSVAKGCLPLPVSFTFTTTNTASVSSYRWDFGDGDSSSQSGPTHIYKSPGSFSPKVTVVFSNGTKCTATLSKPLKVFTSPNADFISNKGNLVMLCNRGDKVCFTDKSTPGASKASVISWLWSFSDGPLSTEQNPCHVFSDSGLYKITLEVQDSNGCKSFIQKNVEVRFTQDIGFKTEPNFNINIYYDCVSSTDFIKFNNTTDTVLNFITKFIWDFDDGTKDSCDLTTPGCASKWSGLVHNYTKSGTYDPSLYIENKFGCSNKLVLDTPIEMYPFKLSIQQFPAFPTCFSLDTLVNFTAPYHNQALYYTWDFGDPYSRAMGALPATNHTYKHPGTYTVYFKMKIGNCIYDSTLCKTVKLLGPIAKIMPLKGVFEPWDSVPLNGTYLIPPSKIKTYFDTSCLGPPNVTYYTYKATLIPKGEEIDDTCRADTIKTFVDSLPTCNGKRAPAYITTYRPHIKGYKDTIEQIPTAHVWSRGDPWPTGNVYSKPPFIDRPLYMNDTSLFSLRCKAPQKISFTNFSEKYRGYDAIDNFPPGVPDKCHNPVYPYASDSLSYNWDFKEGTGSTSTKTNKDPYARYSTEKLPTHIFQKDGCYWVTLTVNDTLTNCYDIDSVPVVLQGADAGWAPQYSGIKNMTWLIQKHLPKKGPRRGAIIGNGPCLLDTQIIIVGETLPSCYKIDYAMVLDSAKDVKICNGLKGFNWLHKDTLESYFANFFYHDTGWKTIGLAVTNNANCTDTVWYHNYKYIHGIYPAIQVSADGSPPTVTNNLHICAGDTLKMLPYIKDQPGIQSFVYYYAEEADRGDTVARFTNDTLKYIVQNDSISKTDTITSTVHNDLWGINDGGLNFNHLLDTVTKKIPVPGHVTIMTVIKSRFGCLDTAWRQVTVGHYTDFNVANQTLCTGDTAHFEGLAQYFEPFTKNNTGYDPRMFWKNPDSVRHGRHPKIPEQMQWDLDGDSIIDYTGPNPNFVYTRPGSYTITMYSRDSSGCVQKLVRKDYMKVIGSEAYFTVGPPGDTRYCSGSHFFNFIDSSYVIKPFKDSLNRYHIYSWTWDFGDGSAPITITDTSKRSPGHVYVTNGDFKVTLTVSTSPGTGASGTGCRSTFVRTVHVLGPTAQFSIVGPNAGCVPFTLKVRDESKKAKVREWLLGDGTAVTSQGDSIVYLTYKRPGVFCPQFFVADTLIDLQGKPLYCADTFPAKCALKVVVYDTNKQVLSASDTLLCVDRDSVFFKSVPDTGYKNWTIHYGNGDSATGAPPKFGYIYHNTGRYHVVISGSGAHCPDTSSVNIHVIDVKADFAIDTARRDTPVFSFINKSLGAVHYTWNFGDGSAPVNTKLPDEITHEFIKAGISNVCLVAYNTKNCPDSVCHEIKIDTFVNIPNVFTPNGDGFNNHYVIEIYGHKYYYLDIYNRWGELVFHSDDKHITWDGTDHTTGKIFPEGTYYGVFKYRFIGGKTQFRTTGVTLIRK